MNMIISSVNSNNFSKNKSFGMARFTEKGYQLASLHADIYKELGQPNNFQNPEFFKKVPFLQKAPFTKYFLANSKRAPQDVAETIVKCGATDNIASNAMFINQLLATEKYIHSSDENGKKIISDAVNEVFKKNWDNPEVSQKDTFRLLELAKYSIDEKAYVSICGVILNALAK